MTARLICCLSLCLLFGQASSRTLWSLSSPLICLPMNDISYDPFGSITEDVSEELRQGAFGQETLYCKRGCCGDNRAPECCAPEDDVGQKTFETYKLITVIAAGVGGLAIIGVIIVAIVKWQMKKRRLIRDIEALNRTNRMTDLKTKTKGIGYSDQTKKGKKRGESKRAKVFSNSKKASVVHVKSAPFEAAPVPPPASYATVDTQSFHNTASPAAGPVGKQPVFLPSSQPSFPASSATAPQPETMMTAPKPETRAQAAAGRNNLHFQPLPSLRTGPITADTTPLAEPPVSNVFSTPHAGNPMSFLGPIGTDQTAPNDHTASTSFNKDPSTKHGASSNNTSDMPWGDADFLLYFSNPPRS